LMSRRNPTRDNNWLSLAKRDKPNRSWLLENDDHRLIYIRFIFQYIPTLSLFHYNLFPLYS
jgi:hypothetical protein